MENRSKRLKIFHTKGESESRIEEDVNNWLAKNPQNVIHQRQLHFLRGERSDQIEYVIEIWYEVGPKPVPDAKVKPKKGMEPSILNNDTPGEVFDVPANIGAEELDEPEATDQELEEPGHEDEGLKLPPVPSETEEKEFIQNRNKPVNVRK